jgi:hypothetical protein
MGLLNPGVLLGVFFGVMAVAVFGSPDQAHSWWRPAGWD